MNSKSDSAGLVCAVGGGWEERGENEVQRIKKACSCVNTSRTTEKCYSGGKREQLDEVANDMQTKQEGLSERKKFFDFSV
jgi:hypothetical protein